MPRTGDSEPKLMELISGHADCFLTPESFSTEDESAGLQFTPLVGILLGAIIALLLIALAVVLTLRRVRARELRSARRDTEESREKMLSMHIVDGDCVGNTSPDVVPCTSTLLDRRKGGSREGCVFRAAGVLTL